MRGDKNMGVFETIFRKPKADLKAEGYFKMLNGYTPVFSNAPESIYEMELTRAAQDMFEEIKNGLVTKMSWAFRVSEDSYDRDTRTRTILKIAKVYDVSAVSIPANADTDISARSYCDGVIEREQQERLERRKKLLKIKLMTEV